MGLRCVEHTLFVLLCSGCVTAWFNLFVSRTEGKRILGLNAELRYVDNGTVNDYALGFSIMVPEHVWELFFTWNSLKPTPIPYTIDIGVSNYEAMMRPQLNITRKGFVPMHLGTFRLLLRCTGKVDAEVGIFMRMNFSMPPPFPESIYFTLKRKKICHIRNNTSGDSLTIADAMIDTTGSLYIAVGFISAFILIVAMVAVLCYVRTVKARMSDVIHYGETSPVLLASTQNAFLKSNTPSVHSHANSFASSKKLTSSTNIPYEHVSSLKQIRDLRHVSEYVAEIRMDRRNIILREKIQKGTYGRIYSAVIVDSNELLPKRKPAIVKTVTDQANSFQTSLLIKEGMKMLGLQHEYVLPLIGLCTEDQLHPILVYPFMANGNLKLFLQQCSAGYGCVLTTIDLVSMAIQIIKAIEYLHYRGVIHKDIATRNCVVNEDLQIKLADNALARDLFPNDYHCLCDSENRPIKWLAVESIVRNEFSFETDVWSFGVTLWELVTLGHQPYASVDAFEMFSTLMDGYRLNQPKNCPDDLYKLMWYCWSELPEIRPSVRELVRCLQDLYIKLGSFI
ncbi:tyrosine-protein kinase RYK isoform X1 [Parasteatoda tepidariorum]|uniref:tyrosine-protein kinase RYK isoform X1 n=2 Tax=Parasteatoda tepidariorum TaxID=114398 RepID=UPI001C728704|nr:tyrosine-protein kinase RYK isoform X1 [Parasteatoda tepidariorum]